MPASRRRTAVVRPTTPAPTTTALTPAPRARRAGARAAARAPGSSRGRGAWAGRGRRARRAAPRGRARDERTRGAAKSRRERASAPATCSGPVGGRGRNDPSSASSSTAAARSPTSIGQRTSSVKKAMSRAPSATSSTIRSCGAGSAPPKMSEVRTIRASGGHSRSASSLDAPYGVTGAGSSSSVSARVPAREDDVAGDVHEPRPGGGRGRGDRARAVDVDARVVEAIGGVHDHVRPRGADAGEHRGARRGRRAAPTP